MTFADLCILHWPALRGVARKRELIFSRSLRAGDGRLPCDLDCWTDESLLPALREVFPDQAITEELLVSAGLVAWLNSTKEAPLSDMVEQIERALTPAGFIAPVGNKAADPARPWQALVQRLLAFAGGWGRRIGAGLWDGVWGGAVMEFTIATRPHLEHVLRKLWNTAPSVEWAMRPRMGCTREAERWKETSEYFDHLTGFTLIAVNRFLAPLPLNGPKGAQFLHLQGWNPAKGTLYGWLETMLEGEANTGGKVRTNAFRYGALAHALKGYLPEEGGGAENVVPFAEARRTGWQVCWSEACIRGERLGGVKRIRRPAFTQTPCPTCGSTPEFRDVSGDKERIIAPLVDEERIIAPDEFEEFQFSKCTGSKPDHFILLRAGQKPADAKCPLHPESGCSQVATKLWLQMPGHDDDLPRENDATESQLTPAEEVMSRFADPKEDNEQ